MLRHPRALGARMSEEREVTDARRGVTLGGSRIARFLCRQVRESGNDAWEIGNELFTITYVFDHNPRIPRALTDPGRPTEDKVALLNNLLGKQALPLTMEILTDLVGRSWSRAGDIDNAIEDFAVDAMMYQADDEKKTLKVSVQLAQLQSALLNLPVVRSDLSDSQGPLTSATNCCMHSSMVRISTASPCVSQSIAHATRVTVVTWNRCNGSSTSSPATWANRWSPSRRRPRFRTSSPTSWRGSTRRRLGARSIFIRWWIDRHGWHAHPGRR